MATGANCGNSAFRMAFNIIYIMRTMIEAARLCGFDQNSDSVNHPGILLMAHSAQFFTLDEVNPFKRTLYRLWPMLACEKLAELHDVHLYKETVRSLMVKAGLWIPRKQRAPKIQQSSCLLW